MHRKLLVICVCTTHLAYCVPVNDTTISHLSRVQQQGIYILEIKCPDRSSIYFDIHTTIYIIIRIQYFSSRAGKEGNVLFNDTLNTFYLRLYGITHMVKYHSDSEREETRCRHMGYFPISSKGSFICTTGVTKAVVCCHPVCGMVHIKEPLVLIKKSSPCGNSGFPLSLSEWSFTICLTPYNHK